MLDIKLLRGSKEEVEKKLRMKVADLDLSSILTLDTELRELKTKTDELKAKRNSLSEEIGKLKREKKEAATVLEEVAKIKSALEKLEKALLEKEEVLADLLAHLPNIPNDEIPLTLDPKKNVCIKEWGQKRIFSFPFKNHVELNEKLHLFDFKRGAKITGSNWPLYVDLGARLEWALLQYMLDMQRKNGFKMIMPPLLARKEIMYGSAQLPKFHAQLFKLEDKDYPLYLIPTSEVPLNGIHYDEILEEEELPIKYTAYTPCFRREAGAAGSQERGLIRMHQFNKVELFTLCKPEESEDFFAQMVVCAEKILQGLGLHYRNMLLVSGDMSFASAKTVDIEVWLPGQDRYYEVSSVSNCTDFQARRSNIRYREGGGKPKFVHTLNGSALATSRLMVAILENFQKEDGSVEIPSVLHRYLEEEIEQITPNG